MSNRLAVLAALAMMLAVSVAAAQAFELPITVQESAGVDRVAAPVSGGVPLPMGQFKTGQAFALFADNQEVPVQVSPLVVEADGTLRWVLLDFQTDLKAKQAKQFVLKDVAPKSAPAKALKLTETADAITIDTGKATLVISKTKPFGLFDSVTVDGKPVVTGGLVSYTDGWDGKVRTAQKPASVEVEYNGALRATVAIKGGFVDDEQTKMGYIARITAWAGRGDVFVKYSLANSNDEHYTYRQIKDSSIALTLAGSPKSAILGGSSAVQADSGDVALEQGAVASAANGAKAIVAGKDSWVSKGKGDTAQGWIALVQPNVSVQDLYFIEDAPRRLSCKDGKLVLAGVIERYYGEQCEQIEKQCAELLAAKNEFKDDKAKQKELDQKINEVRAPLRDMGRPFGARYRWIFDSSHLTSQYVLDFAAPADAAALAESAKANKLRLMAMAPPAWYFESEALSVGKFGTQADELKCYETWGWKFNEKQVPTQPGAHNGARFIRGEDNHYETEEDIVESLLLMYLRTGQRSFYETAQAWLNYNVDLQAWRTDGWRYRDGGVWWTSGGPLGNRPQRGRDPVSDMFNGGPAPWTRGMKTKKVTIGWDTAVDLSFLANSKACFCHNWGEGLAGWYCITGDRDVLEAAIDNVEQNFDTQIRTRNGIPGKRNTFSRDFTRSCYVTNAVRMVVPTDPFVINASDLLAAVYLKRPKPEVRGLVEPAGPIKMEEIKKLVGQGGLDEMKKRGVELNPSNGMLVDPATFAQWHPVANPHTWMFPPLSQAMDAYCQLTGNEDAMDWTIAYGQAVSYVLFQERHGNLDYGRMLVDFPVKGMALDYASWNMPKDAVNGQGWPINGYLAEFHPDVAARAYSYCGEPQLKQRAYDYWFYGSHRGYNAKSMHNVGGVGRWVNYYGQHSESVNFTGRTFYIHANPRTDTEAPAAVTDLKVTVNGDKATVSFTAPADKGGKVARYQLKCAEKKIVDYQTYLKLFAENKEAETCNWWMATNLAGEPVPAAPGQKVTFEVTGLPVGTAFFAVRSFDDSSNRSPISNVVEAK